MYVLDVIFKEHGSVGSGANWNGSPDPSNYRNIRRKCMCGEAIGWHDTSRQRNGVAYPMSGYPFDEPHLAHIREVLEELGYE